MSLDLRHISTRLPFSTGALKGAPVRAGNSFLLITAMW
nr:MAG TPA: hypothetical protein [Caudoviricetes sp.]